uniref:T9SS type A sorting domain-containing protein n=1 Tax=Eiseniibacteriota bacterium TaxID=2212470 RepID=A0A832I0I3_UNCEI
MTGTDRDPPPPEVALAAPWPNPARSAVHLRFALPRPLEATLRVHDVHGRLVRRLMQGPLAAGWHGATWDGRDEAGRTAPPGMYLARLEAAGTTARTRRFVRIE